MTRIAYFIDTIETAGAGTEKQLLMLLEGLDRRRYDPVLVCLRPSPWLAANDLPCPVEVLDLYSRASFVGPRALAVYRALQRRHGFGLVQTFFVDANIVGTLMAKVAGVPRVISSRRNIGYWQGGSDRLVLRVLSRWTSHYIANSRAARDSTVDAEGVDPARISVINNGLDVAGLAARVAEEKDGQRQLLGLGPDDRLVVSVANLRPVKDVATLVEAAAAVVARAPRTRFAVLGEGDQRPDLEARIARHGLQESFLLPGSAADVVPWLAAADIAVQGSRSESFSNALVEYMAAGLPSVATAVGGNVEAVDDGRTGLLCPASDPAAMADRLVTLLEDGDLAARMGTAAAADALERFSVEACLDRTQDCYDRVLAHGRRKGGGTQS
jgi:glycosyltransferase involved in cell wall biosynthesis